MKYKIPTRKRKKKEEEEGRGVAMLQHSQLLSNNKIVVFVPREKRGFFRPRGF
jgi:hypothetical protein